MLANLLGPDWDQARECGDGVFAWGPDIGPPGDTELVRVGKGAKWLNQLSPRATCDRQMKCSRMQLKAITTVRGNVGKNRQCEARMGVNADDA